LKYLRKETDLQRKSRRVAVFGRDEGALNFGDEIERR
jgi:hypothetical protein